MKLYHGGNTAVRHPVILASDRKLDFGVGFYLTSCLEQAKRWAILTAERRGVGQPTISVYQFDEAILSTLKVLHFEKADKRWLNFIVANRERIPSINVGTSLSAPLPMTGQCRSSGCFWQRRIRFLNPFDACFRKSCMTNTPSKMRRCSGTCISRRPSHYD